MATKAAVLSEIGDTIVRLQNRLQNPQNPSADDDSVRQTYLLALSYALVDTGAGAITVGPAPTGGVLSPSG